MKRGRPPKPRPKGKSKNELEGKLRLRRRAKKEDKGNDKKIKDLERKKPTAGVGVRNVKVALLSDLGLCQCSVVDGMLCTVLADAYQSYQDQNDIQQSFGD